LPPARKLAVVACMDARLMVDQVLGLKIGDAHVIRNAGGLATEDALRCLVISHHLLGTQEFFVIEHTGCGMLTFDEEPVKQQIARATGADTAALRLYPFKNLEENLTAQVRKIKECPWIPKTIPVHGFIYPGRGRPAPPGGLIRAHCALTARREGHDRRVTSG
jgi:carbonic anhydrase